jgi:CBS domain containing-hemolysin-like protein
MLAVLTLIHLPKFSKDSPEPQASEAGEESILLEALSSQHRQYVMNLVHLERKRMRDIFVPWKHVIHVEPAQSAEQVEEIILASGHTRIPVC